jgi:hypothetical protein
MRQYDDDFQRNLMNLSIATAVKNFGRVAEEACKAELVQSCLKKTHFGTSELE